jgi:hypothetical protein
VDAFEIKAKYPEIWECMCLYGIDFNRAKDRLETEKSVLANSQQVQYEESEQSDEYVEVDTEQKKEIVNHIIDVILDSSIDREKQLQKVSELVKSYSRESEIILKLAAKYLEFLKLQNEEAERESKDYDTAIQAFNGAVEVFNTASTAFFELNKRLHDEIERYTKLQDLYNSHVLELNSRLGH